MQINKSGLASNDFRVVILGGGLAGLAAAVHLSSHGVRVTVVETRKRLGGRASSFVDPANGRVLDNCQHVLMGCCTNLIDLYRKLGVADSIRWHKRLYFADSRGHIDYLEGDDLPAPLHMTRSLLGFQSLTLSEKFAIVRAMTTMIRIGRAGREQARGMTFERWLAKQRQPDGAVEKFWAVICISALNELPDRVDASYALQVFQEGFLSNSGGYVMGVPGVPLVELYQTAAGVIEQAGGKVMLSTSAEEFVLDDDGHVVALGLSGGERLTADAFVSTVPFDRLARLCPPRMVAADPRLQQLQELHVSPIIGIHMWFRRGDEAPPAPRDENSRGSSESPWYPVMELPHLILMRGRLQWVFNKGYDPQVGGQHLHGVISAAHDLVDKPAEEITALAVQDVLRAIPNAADAKLVHARVVKERRATFSAAPGIASLRPEAAGELHNLYLAGDWCQTGWPATMEGAVRSGYNAAAAILGQPRPETEPLVPDLPLGRLYQLLSGAASTT